MFTPCLRSLLVSFRVFTGQHTAAQLPHIFGQLRAALLRQLEAALEAAKQVGGACVPLLPAEQVSAAAFGLLLCVPWCAVLHCEAVVPIHVVAPAGGFF